MRAAAVWAGIVLLPELLFRTGGHIPGVGSAVFYVVSIGASLVLWLGLVRGIAWLRQRKAWAGWTLLGLASLLLPLFLTGTLRHFALTTVDIPHSAVTFFLRNPGYAWNIAASASSGVEILALFGGPVAMGAILAWLTRAPLPSWPGRQIRIGVSVATALVVGAAFASPRLPVAADIHGLRALALGTWTWLTQSVGLPKPDRVKLEPYTPKRAPNVVIFLHESWGARQLAPWNGKPQTTPGIAALLAERRGNAVWFEHASANAGATDVSLPSLLSGLGADGTAEDYTRAPLLWHDARAAGYATAMFSAQAFTWAGFHDFFLGEEGPDVYKTAEGFGDEPVNDAGIDDSVPVRAAIDYLEKAPADKPFLLIIHFNATHWPCWAPSLEATDKHSVERSDMPHRCGLASQFLDGQVVKVLQALKARGQLEESLLMMTADHGVDFGSERSLDRGGNFYEPTLAVPMFVHLPDSMVAAEPGAVKALMANRSRRVGNVDLVPTLLDVWGRWPIRGGGQKRPALVGRSLIRPVAEDRTLVTVNTGDLRAWSEEGFALYKGHRKLLADEYGVFFYDLLADPAEKSDRYGSLSDAESRRFLGEVGRRPPLLKILKRVAPEAGAKAERFARDPSH